MTTAPQQQIARPSLTLVKDEPPQPVEGAVVEPQGAEVATRPEWLTAIYEHARTHRLYAPQISRGYGRLVRRLIDGYHDDHPQMIATAKADRKAARGDAHAEARAHRLVQDRRADYRRHRLFYALKTGGWAAFAGTGVTVTTIGAPVLDIPLALAALGLGAWHGRHCTEGHQGLPTNIDGATLPASGIAPTAGDERVLTALKGLGFNGEIIQPLTRQPDGSSTMTVDLDDTVTALKSKSEALAGALKRDASMVDVSKGAHANQAQIWMADADPFEDTRPSPLVQNPGPIDAWTTGVPVGWGKRGNTVRLLIRNQHTLIGGTTRSGKGVGMANLLVGAAMDPRINLRIVAGKENGEFDALARADVAATYFKPNPTRLLALTRALIADMDRRNRILGELGKSKMTEDTIMRLGGIELIVIDEVATYTSSGSHDERDQLLENLMKIAAVATGAGILLVLTTQLPQVDVIPTRLSMNCGTKWAMKVDSGTQSNTILGSGLAGSGGPDASKFDPPRPGLGWLNNPFAGGTDLARSFDLDEDERGEVTRLMKYAAKLRADAGRLAGQWDDPIEKALLSATGLSSAAGGPNRNGVPGRAAHQVTPAQQQQAEAMRGALAAMDSLGRDVAQTKEMAEFIGEPMTADALGALLRDGGAGGTVKITIPGQAGRVNGYQRADIADALEFLTGA
ncbi:FtsK/SpoIIIE domain-containing protein [Streptomyces sp. NPDC059534]|uniref:FtsK/SpoIIIE domain-containing protein n=1 Tax=Streptomyces sp. NPDC059534 TaxID=3346859 RepID=UPI00368911FD